jgi:predicted DNA-binding transcriptional regulator AlpA
MELLKITETAKLLDISFSQTKRLIENGLIPRGIMYGAKNGMRLVKSEVLKYKELRDSRQTPDEIRAYWLAQDVEVEGQQAA